MVNQNELRSQAKELRLAANYKDALPLYQKLWEETKAELDAAGVLYCLRKEKEYDKALFFSKQINAGSYQMDWLKNELAWTYIEGRLLKYKNDAKVSHVIEIAIKVLNLNPDPIAVKTAVFIVLKTAKQYNRWDIINEWTSKIDPNSLSSDPNITNNRPGWSDQSSWYNYRIRSYIELNYYDKALLVVKTIEDRFPRERKHFLRLKGLAAYRLGLLQDAMEIYKQLCAVPKPDWWFLHEYANVIRGLAQKDNNISMKEQAFELMCQAADNVARSNKLEALLKILRDIADISSELNREQITLPHLLLLKLIREDNRWPISPQLSEDIRRLSLKFGNDYLLKTKRELLSECQKIWSNVVVHQKALHRPIRVTGNVILGPVSRLYCFIIAGGKNCFCPKSKLPPGLKEGDIVKAEIVSAFDSKKKQDGWKAVKVWKE